MKDAYRKNYFDTNLLFIIFLFMIISCFSIYSSEKYLPDPPNHYAFKQVRWYFIGIVLSACVYVLDFEQIKKISLFSYVSGILILIALHFAPESIAHKIKGAKSWFSVPGFGSIQPSEFMKIFLIIFLAKIIVDHNKKYVDRSLKTDFRLIFKVFSATSIPLGLILLQPDAGTGMVIMVILIGMLFLSGIHWKIVGLLGVLGSSILGVLVLIYTKAPDLLLLFLDKYQLERIHSWLDPFQYKGDIGYQLSQSILAIGSGTMYGKGYYSGQVYIPEAHSDFIFTTIGEEYGFLGGSVVITLYFILIYRIVAIALLNKGSYENLIAAGVVSMLTFHIFENIGMVMGLVPITGIPLPLLSYGGSSILGTLIALSLILNISAKTKKYMFEQDSTRDL